MSPPPGALLAAWARLFIDGLAAAGVTDLVQSPGSRSTPFLLAALDHGGLRVHPVLDERAAGFLALGLAKATGRPTALLCTSGTAGAHYLPAIVEAAESYTPLVVVTADRPFELARCAAPQTIDQVKLFGDRARAYIELGLPDPSEDALRGVRRRAAQAVALARSPLPGAVHVNARARKPLEPPLAGGAAEPSGEPLDGEAEALRARLLAVERSKVPRFFAPRLAPDPQALDLLAIACGRARRGVIVAGPAPLSQGAARGDIGALARATGFPLLPEATSQLRFVPQRSRDGVTVCDGFEAFLRARAFRDAQGPDLVLQVGAPPTSVAFEAWLDAWPACERWVIAPHGCNDPRATAHAHLAADVGETVRALLPRLAAAEPKAAEIAAWAERLAAANAVAWREVLAHVACAAADPGLGEAAIVRAAVASVPRGGILAVGNSLSIREVEAYCGADLADCKVWSQRGANGIDGLLAGGAGAALSGSPTTLILGDLAFLHDLGGLATASLVATPFVVVVLQNHGGRIFETLPIGARADLARHLDHFTTPHALSLSPAARLFGHRYAQVSTQDELAAALAVAQATAGCTVIEAMVSPGDAARATRALGERLEAAFAAEPAGGGRAAAACVPGAAKARPRGAAAGAAPTVIFLHGFTGAPESWEEVVARLPAGTAHLEAALVGHAGAELDTAGDFEGEVDRLAMGLRARADLPVCLVGYSLGARLALGLLARHPRLFASAVLIGVHPGLASAAERAARAEADLRLALLLEREGLAPFVAAWECQPLFTSQRGLDARVLARQRALRLAHRPEGLAHSLRTVGLARMPDYRNALARLDLPIRLVVGEADADFRSHATALARSLPRASLTVAVGAGHNVALEQPQTVLAAILEVNTP